MYINSHAANFIEVANDLLFARFEVIQCRRIAQNCARSVGKQTTDHSPVLQWQPVLSGQTTESKSSPGSVGLAQFHSDEHNSHCQVHQG